jgi:hypothetical protein
MACSGLSALFGVTCIDLAQAHVKLYVSKTGSRQDIAGVTTWQDSLESPEPGSVYFAAIAVIAVQA